MSSRVSARPALGVFMGVKRMLRKERNEEKDVLGMGSNDWLLNEMASKTQIIWA